MLIENQAKPSIKVAISRNFNNPGVLKEITSGIEEESIPFEVVNIPNDDAVELAYQAALESILDVGVGADSKGSLAVHYKKLRKNKPLFKLNYEADFDKLKTVCANSARLVKGIPFIFEEIDQIARFFEINKLTTREAENV
jgi:hypothetical protein